MGVDIIHTGKALINSQLLNLWAILLSFDVSSSVALQIIVYIHVELRRKYVGRSTEHIYMNKKHKQCFCCAQKILTGK